MNRRHPERIGNVLLAQRKGKGLALDQTTFDEVQALLGTRNEVFWVNGILDPPSMQFDFNGLWFEMECRVFRF